MDEIDAQIIEKLTKNSRASFRKIAKELGISTDTVIRRYEALRKNGTIQPIILIDSKKIGFKATTWFYVIMSNNDSSTIIDELVKIHGVFLITKAIGDYDLLVVALIRSIDDFSRVENDIMKIPGIARVKADQYLLHSGRLHMALQE